MKINDIKENRIFQIIICSIFGLFMLWSQAYLEKEHEEILKEIDEIIEELENDRGNAINKFKII